MIDFHAFSEAGGHPINEDTYLLRRHPLDEDCWLCCIADGQGGRAGGARAAQVACEAAMELACRTAIEKLNSVRQWIEIVEQADRSVEADNTAGFTTLAVFGIFRNIVTGASSGDSAVLLLSDESPTILTERQRKNPPVGSGEAIATGFSSTLRDGWRVLAMTDGVWKYVGWDRIFELTKSHRGASVLDGLQEPARLPGSGKFQDDFTVVALQQSASGGA